MQQHKAAYGVLVPRRQAHGKSSFGLLRSKVFRMEARVGHAARIMESYLVVNGLWQQYIRGILPGLHCKVRRTDGHGTG